MKVFLIGLGILVASLLLTIACLRRDWIDPCPGVNLTPSRPLLEIQDVPENGAFDLLSRAGEALGGKKPRVECDRALFVFMEDPKGSEAVEAAKDLEDAAEALSLARLASAKGDAQVPTPHFDSNPPYLAKTIGLVNLLSVSAARKAALGDVPGALNDLEAGIRLGQILSRGGENYHHMLDIACTNTFCRTLGFLSLNRALTPATLRDAHESGLAVFRATRAFLAIREFEAVKGRPPKDSAELVPGFLPDWPLDPFNGKPLNYRLNPDGSWVVYSVGPTLIGTGKDPDWKYNVGDLSFPSTAWEAFAKAQHEKEGKKTP